MNPLKRIIPLLQFTTGQRMRLLQRIREVAIERGLREFMPTIDRAIEHERETQELENLWAGNAGRRLYADQVGDIDNLVDPLLGSIHGLVRSHAQGLSADDPFAVMCEDFLARVFPNGLSAITSLPYVEQVAAVEIIVGKLGGELDGAVRELGLERKRERLSELTAEYRRLINEGRRDLRFAEVREARERGLQRVREVVVMVAGRFHDPSDPGQAEALEAFLGPVIAQLDESTARNRAQRRSRVDASGEELPEGLEGSEDDGSVADLDGEESDDLDEAATDDAEVRRTA